MSCHDHNGYWYNHLGGYHELFKFGVSTIVSAGLGEAIQDLGLFGYDLDEGLVIEQEIQMSKSRFGHTFTTHGEDMTDFLMQRANGSGMAQGQFLDNQAAAKFIETNLDKIKNGAVSLPIPKNFPARMINADGTFGVPTHIRLVPGGKGVKTAYPEY